MNRLALSFAALLLLAGSPSAQVTVGPLRRVSVASHPARRTLTPPNFVVILVDDFGVDMLGAYAEGSDPPCTPNIDALAADGLLFRNAWANPTCSPTRASLLTGRHAFRTGMGSPATNMGFGLPLSELLLPEALVGYDSTCVGKWHLGGNLGATHPNASGFGRFAGLLAGTVTSYTSWPKTVDGSTSVTGTYATTDIANEAIASLGAMQEPWFLYVSFNAPHTPFHEPPSALCPTPGCVSQDCGNLPPNPTNRQLGKAMVEALDTELGRFLAALDAVDPAAWVFLMGDNGTARQLTEAPFQPLRAKGTIFEGGVNVPLIVRGPGVVPGECGALVSCVDLFATITELAGVPTATEDSVSLVPLFSNPALAVRETVYSELFEPNGFGLQLTAHDRAVRNERYKLVRRLAAADELYDILLDPFETTNLLPGLTVGEQLAYDELEAELVALGVD